MHKISIPMSLTTMTYENRHKYLDILKKCKAERVFLCGLGYIYTPSSLIYTKPEFVREMIGYFKENGLEVGIWVDAFGHGEALSGTEGIKKDSYTPIEGVDGKISEHSFCPSDERFVADYTTAIRRIACFQPDIIMLDDDFRFNVRGGSFFNIDSGHYYMGCFCPYHLKRYYELIGEEVPREKIEELAFTGEKNKYRDAYYDMLAESLLDFAKMLRNTVDEINPNIRLGASFTCEGWDTCGTDIIEIARAFAGNTQPFARIPAAPYWNSNIIPVVEAARMQYVWRKDSGVEMFSEGDTYPRPRYNVPSKSLELFDFLLLADGGSDGILTYLVDYHQQPDYERGYVERFVRNEPIRAGIKYFFQNKTSVGVHVFNVMHKARNYSLPEKLVIKSSHRIEELQLFSPGQELLSSNSLPTAFEANNGYPVLVFGENAKYIPLDELKNGAILDVTAANILKSRGVDVGLLSNEPKAFFKELFLSANDAIPDISHPYTQKIEIADSATAESKFLPDNTPATYLYENANGEKFFVIAFDYAGMHGGFNANYLKNYYRQAQLQSAIEWLCGKKLPATAAKHPNLYVLTSKGNDDSLAVAVANVHLDDVYDADIQLAESYSSARFIGGSGTLQGNKIHIEHLPPYAFIAFELHK